MFKIISAKITFRGMHLKCKFHTWSKLSSAVAIKILSKVKLTQYFLKSKKKKLCLLNNKQQISKLNYNIYF